MIIVEEFFWISFQKTVISEALFAENQQWLNNDDLKLLTFNCYIVNQNNNPNWSVINFQSRFY